MKLKKRQFSRVLRKICVTDIHYKILFDLDSSLIKIRLYIECEIRNYNLKGTLTMMYCNIAITIIVNNVLVRNRLVNLRNAKLSIIITDGYYNLNL